MSDDVSLPADKAALANELLRAYDGGDLSAGHALLDLAEETGCVDILHQLARGRESASSDRLGILRVSLELLKSVLLLPDDCEIQAVSEHAGFMRRELVLRIRSPRLREVLEGNFVPEYQMQYRETNRVRRVVEGELQTDPPPLTTVATLTHAAMPAESAAEISAAVIEQVTQTLASPAPIHPTEADH